MKLFKVQGDKVVNYHLELDELFNDRAEKGTDIWAIHHGYVSITPLHFEVTHDKVIRSMEPCVKKMEKKLL
jgi:broad specificity polyphosphatase/5'/3'-nucleotidase SurE